MTTYERGAETDWSLHPIDFSSRLLVRVDGEGIDPLALRREYQAAEYTTLALRIERAAPLPELGFLEGLDLVRELDVVGPVRDDTYAFSRSDITHLSLLTRCTRPIPDADLEHLEQLTLDSRRGYQRVHDLPRLNRLNLFGWNSPDLTFLGHMPRLEHLRIESRKLLLSLAGLERCPRLHDLWLDGPRVDSLEPLRSLSLTRLWVLGRQGATPEPVLDLSNLMAMTELRDLRLLHAGAVQSVRPLLDLPSLSSARLAGTRIADGDEAPLRRLAGQGVSV